jgi:E3 ubiquitin-protein ligase UBR4
LFIFSLFFLPYFCYGSYIFAIKTDVMAAVGNLTFLLCDASSNGAKSGSGSQPLVQWTEVHGHAGLVCALTQTSNAPIVMMVTPDSIRIQEVRIQPAKAKVRLNILQFVSL